MTTKLMKNVCVAFVMVMFLWSCSAEELLPGDNETATEFETDSEDPPNETDYSTDPPEKDTGRDLTAESCEHPMILEPFVPWVAHGANMQDELIDDHNWNEIASCTTDTDVCPSGFANPCRAFNSEVVFQAEMTQGQSLHLKTESKASVVLRVLDHCSPDEGQCLMTQWAGSYQPVNTFVAPADGTYFGVLELREPIAPIKIGEWLDNDILINTPTNLEYYLEAGVYDDTEHNCTDGKDNDGNSLIDCVDPACFETCVVTVHFEEIFNEDVASLGETFENSYTPYTIDMPATLATSFGDVQDPEVIGWHLCGNSGFYRSSEAPFCIQPGFKDKNQTRSDSKEGYLLMADNDEVGLAGGSFVETSSINHAGAANTVLTFAQAAPKSKHPVYVQVQVSVDDGSSWKTIRRYDRYSKLRRVRMAGYQVVDLSAEISGASAFKVRFQYTDGGMTSGSEGSYAGDWQLDDIRIFSGTFDVVTGMAGDDGFDAPVVPVHQAAHDGCDGSDTVCENLHGHDFGACETELGWYFNGRVCELASGCSDDGYCLYATLEDCARGCSAAGECNMDAFLGTIWPERGVEIPIMGEGSFEVLGTADNWTAVASISEDDPVYDVPFDNPSCAYGLFPEVVRCTKWPPLLAGSMTWEDAWEYLCGYSLVDEMVFIDFDPPFRGTPK